MTTKETYKKKWNMYLATIIPKERLGDICKSCGNEMTHRKKHGEITALEKKSIKKLCRNKTVKCRCKL